MTQILSNYSESGVEFQFHQWLNFLGQNDSIFSFSGEQNKKSASPTLLMKRLTAIDTREF